ncbi:hypothetical protein JDW21_18870 [Bacillus subtilis]|uniref:hypothetical protein n=1 Tax=Bacillus subtilis TaxID=1423 RepID=UPI002ED06480
MIEFKKGDRVEHSRRGKGTFLSQGIFHDESIVEFDKNSDAEGETLVVTAKMLKENI